MSPTGNRGRDAAGPRSLRLVAVGAIAIVSAALAACAGYSGYGLRAGAPAAEVKAAMGAAQRVWKEANGGETWEYANGPMGTATFMARIAPDGRLTAVDQVLSEPFFAKIVPGMTTREVEHILGRPYDVVRYAGLSEEVWSWRYIQSGVWRRCFYAHFGVDGRLARTSAGDEQEWGPFGRLHRC